MIREIVGAFLMVGFGALAVATIYGLIRSTDYMIDMAAARSFGKLYARHGMAVRVQVEKRTRGSRYLWCILTEGEGALMMKGSASTPSARQAAINRRLHWIERVREREARRLG